MHPLTCVKYGAAPLALGPAPLALGPAHSVTMSRGAASEYRICVSIAGADPGLTVGGGGLSTPRALALAKFYVLRPLLDCRGGAKYMSPVTRRHPTGSKVAVVMLLLTVRMRKRISCACCKKK